MSDSREERQVYLTGWKSWRGAKMVLKVALKYRGVYEGLDA